MLESVEFDNAISKFKNNNPYNARSKLELFVLRKLDYFPTSAFPSSHFMPQQLLLRRMDGRAAVSQVCSLERARKEGQREFDRFFSTGSGFATSISFSAVRQPFPRYRYKTKVTLPN